eukprot:TRINITY_DN9522_c0_g4_i1.p1 TRINITY_DN9522_c0_g4~~TRINITY_DN9522_c0_g4_i1.p1  ORF type:complete len:361 (+),score=85.21 TRINITY_DN9522_c0_g4_i1:139-1221(+)
MTALTTAFASLAFNYLTVTGLIFVNKYLFAILRFPPTTLTALHLTFTAGAIRLAQHFRWVPRPSTPLGWRHTYLLAGLQGCAIVAGNASLTFNSMSFYQLAKQLQLPVVLTLELFMYGKRVPPLRMLWLAGAVTGVLVATTQDVRFNALGALCAVLGVVCTATEVVIWSRLQQHHNWGSLELLGSVSPYGALLTGTGAVYLESQRLVAAGALSFTALAVLILSCSCALLVNWSTVLVSGKASAISYTLLGLFKTSSVLVGGVFFDGAPQRSAVAGACFALACIFGYSVQNIRDRQATNKDSPGNSGQGGPPQRRDSADAERGLCLVTSPQLRESLDPRSPSFPELSRGADRGQGPAADGE